MLARKSPAALHISPADLLNPPIGDSLAGSRMLTERFAEHNEAVPTIAVDLLAQGRKLEVLAADPASDYEEVAWAFYRGEIDVHDALAILNRDRGSELIGHGGSASAPARRLSLSLSPAACERPGWRAAVGRSDVRRTRTASAGLGARLDDGGDLPGHRQASSTL